MDVDLSTDLNALLPLVAPLLSGHSDVAMRYPAGARLARGPGAAPRGDLPQLQPAAARHAGHRLLRRPVRVQGDPSGQGAGAAAADPGRRLVLRHRVAGAGRAGRAAHPRGAGGLDRRPGLAGQGARHRPGRPARHHAEGMGWPAAPCGAAAAAPAACQASPARETSSQLARFLAVGTASTLAYVLLYLAAARAAPAEPANAISLLVTAVGNTAVNRPGDLRHPGPRPHRPAPAARAARVRRGAGR